ncbi:MAG TPA: DUF983 domain-containing protein [Gemmatimonadales bacterium]|nr:DUF983 domain-containing protein [Gemmatimonadales bacterium]
MTGTLARRFPRHYSEAVVAPFLRALRLRCPHCGGGPIFTSWSRLLPVCPVCGLSLERGEDGYWLGAYFFNLMAMETAFSVWVVGFLMETWPNPPWDIFQISTVVLMVVFPIVFFPFSKTLFLAFDLLMRPPDEPDFAAPHEPSPQPRRAGSSDPA